MKLISKILSCLKLLKQAAILERRGNNTCHSYRSNGFHLRLAGHAKHRLWTSVLSILTLPTIFGILIGVFLSKVPMETWQNQGWNDLPFYFNLPFMVKLGAGVIFTLVVILVIKSVRVIWSTARSNRLWDHVARICIGAGNMELACFAASVLGNPTGKLLKKPEVIRLVS